MIQQGQRQARWLKPGHGRFKLNFDGSSLGNRGNAGGGGLLRDGSSNFIFGFSIFLAVARIMKLSYALFLKAYLCVSNWGMVVLALNVILILLSAGFCLVLASFGIFGTFENHLLDVKDYSIHHIFRATRRQMLWLVVVLVEPASSLPMRNISLGL